MKKENAEKKENEIAISYKILGEKYIMNYNLDLANGTYSISGQSGGESNLIKSCLSNSIIYVEAMADVTEIQTLTVINSNNENETVSFTMPSGYTFEQFIGSEYDTSGGKFTMSKYGPVPTHRDVYYDGKTLEGVLDITTASGTFYYAGTTGSVTHSG